MLHLSYTPEAGCAWAQLAEFERDELHRNLVSMMTQFGNKRSSNSGDVPCKKIRIDGLNAAMIVEFFPIGIDSIELVVSDILV